MTYGPYNKYREIRQHIGVHFTVKIIFNIQTSIQLS